MDIKAIRDQIARDQLKEALDAMLDWAQTHDSDLFNEAIMFSARLNSLEKNMRMGLISSEQANLNRNQLRQGLLYLAGEVARHPQAQAPANPPAATTTPAVDTAKPADQRRLFISYAREDKSYVDNLEKHLYPLKHQGLLKTWNDSNIQPGQSWSKAIETELRAADFIIFMVSADFLSSTFIREYEIPWAQETHEKNGAVIIPVIVRPCDWTGEFFAKLQAIPAHPSDNRLQPLSNWDNPDAGYLTVVEALKRILGG